MRSLWLLNELDIPFELVDMPFDLKVMRSAEYLSVHPLGRVPCLVDGAFRLFESGAIAEYLCERYPLAGLGRLAGDSERYEWLPWIHYSETMAVHAAALVQQRYFIALAGFVGVSRYLERLRARPAFQASLPVGSTGPIAWLPDAPSLP
jgi:glutathione S-transferase